MLDIYRHKICKQLQKVLVTNIESERCTAITNLAPKLFFAPTPASTLCKAPNRTTRRQSIVDVVDVETNAEEVGSATAANVERATKSFMIRYYMI